MTNRNAIVSRCKDTQRVIEMLANKWRVQFEIEDTIDTIREIGLRQRVWRAVEMDAITEETALKICTLLDDEAG